MKTKLIFIGITATLVSACVGQSPVPEVHPFTSQGPIPGTDFTRYERDDSSNSSSKHSVYMTDVSETNLPLLLVIQGSGCDSVFAQSDGKDSYYAAAAQDIIYGLSRGKHRVIIADKPNVEFGDTGSNGSMVNCSDAFKRSHSLETWTAYLSGALDAAKVQAGSADSLVRILGLSEGAIVAARLAAVRDDVSHVAFISGFGCNQIDDMLVATRRNWIAENPEAKGIALQTGVATALKRSEEAYKRVFNDPTNTSYLIEDQTPLFWSTFGTACPAEDLANSNSRVFVAYGTEDEQISGEGVEEIVTRRLIDGKETTTVRIVGGSHMLATQEENSPFENMLNVFSKALTWMESVGTR